MEGGQTALQTPTQFLPPPPITALPLDGDFCGVEQSEKSCRRLRCKYFLRLTSTSVRHRRGRVISHCPDFLAFEPKGVSIDDTGIPLPRSAFFNGTCL